MCKPGQCDRGLLPAGQQGSLRSATLRQHIIANPIGNTGIVTGYQTSQCIEHTLLGSLQNFSRQIIDAQARQRRAKFDELGARILLVQCIPLVFLICC